MLGAFHNITSAGLILAQIVSGELENSTLRLFRRVATEPRAGSAAAAGAPSAPHLDSRSSLPSISSALVPLFQSDRRCIFQRWEERKHMLNGMLRTPPSFNEASRGSATRACRRTGCGIGSVSNVGK